MDVTEFLEEEVLPGLDSADREDRLRAVTCLQVMRAGGACLERLRVVAARDPEPPVRFAARKALAALEAEQGLAAGPVEGEPGELEPGEDPVEALRSGSPKRRLAACLALREGPRAEAVPALLELLRSDRDPWVLSAAARAVGALGEARHVGALQPLLSHQDTRVVASTLEALGELGDEVAFSLAVPLLSSDDHRVRAAALTIVYRLDPEQALGVLRAMVHSHLESMRASALYCLENLPMADAVPLLWEALIGEHVRGLVLKIVGLLQEDRSPRSIGALSWAARDDGDAVRREIAQVALSGIVDQLDLSEAWIAEARNEFEKALQTRSPHAVPVRRDREGTPSSAASVRPREGAGRARPAPGTLLGLGLGAALLVVAGVFIATTGRDTGGDEPLVRSGRPGREGAPLLAVKPDRVLGTVEDVSRGGRKLSVVTEDGRPVAVKFRRALLPGLESGWIVEVQGRSEAAPRATDGEDDATELAGDLIKVLGRP